VILENERNGAPQPGLRFRVGGQNPDRSIGRHLKIVQINFAHKMPSQHCSTGLVRTLNFIRSWVGVKDKV
jgi:hypothetical protein